jgi:hypothetical protein
VGYSFEELKKIATMESNWTYWKEAMEELINEGK